MRLLQTQFIRLFVVLLLTVFIAETAYAGGMMIISNFAGKNQMAAVEHCHDMQSQFEAAKHSHHKQTSKASCGQCQHCLACVSMLTQTHFKMLTQKMQMMNTTAFVQIYHAPDRTQPQKPPIA